MPRFMIIAGLVGLLAACSAPSAGPDDLAGFDGNALQSIEAPIEQLVDQPAELAVVLVAEEQAWRCLLGPRNALAARGLTVDMLAPGTEVMVVGHPSLTQERVIKATVITLDGQTFALH